MNHLKEKLWPPFRLAMSVAVALRHFQTKSATKKWTKYGGQSRKKSFGQ